MKLVMFYVHRYIRLTIPLSLVIAFVVKDSDKAIGNAIQLMKQAGYKTYWLSNQPPIGIFETLVTKIAMSARH